MKQIASLIFFTILYCHTGYSQTIDSIIVGSGGGFSGQSTAYKVIKHTIYKGKGSLTIRYNEVAKVKAKKLTNIYKIAQKIFLEKQDFDHPYNVYRYIELYDDGKIVKFTWGDPSFETPQEINNLYNQLLDLIKKLKFQPR